MSLDDSHPSLADIAARARRRLPRFVWEFLDSGTGTEASMHRNTRALDRVTLMPGVLGGEIAPRLETDLLGRTHALPFGIAPVGMSGLMWPGAERHLARLGVAERIPYVLSTVAAATPEEVGPHVGDEGWFQFYPPKDPEIRQDLLNRARDSGFRVLVLTVDVATASRRERQRRAGLTMPPRITPRLMTDAILHPAWALATLRAGIPSLVTMERYAGGLTATHSTAHIGYLLRTAPDWDYLNWLRDAWTGPLVVKGVLNPQDAAKIAGIADAVWVSNHGGRQFEAAPAPADVLPAIRKAVGPDYPLIADGGVRSGTDILRYIALGADFVMLGRAFHHGLAAFGPKGAAHVVHILREGLKADLGQLATRRPAEIRGTAL